MKLLRLRPNKKWILVAIGLLLALLVLKIVLLLTAEPKITIDYVAEYNRISRPANYDPNDNAAPYYQKAFDAFVEMVATPEEFRNPLINWPSDYNSVEQTLLENWLTSNSQTFEYFREAVNKPYCWIERGSDDNSVGGIVISDLAQLRDLTKALGWDAKLKANKGEFQAAFENILDCYKAGQHKCRQNLFSTEQRVGLSIKQDAVQNAFVILDKSKIDNKALNFFQDILQAEFDNDTYVPDFTAENLYLYDALQRTFVDNGRGTGRLAWGATYYYGGSWANCTRRLNCFIGPTRNQMVQLIEKVIAISDQTMAKTPWQVKNEGRNYFEEIEKINSSNFFLQILGVNTEGIFHAFYKTRAKTEALITVLAILRFRTDKGQFPASLDELVSAGYLESVPMDPFSDGPLVYKPAEDNFKLYSVGEDFIDDGGVIEAVNKARQEPRPEGTSIIIPPARLPDIVYWPFIDLKKLRYDIIREAKARKEIEEANHPK